MSVHDSDAAPEAELYSSWPLAEDEQDHSNHGGRAMSTEGATTSRLSDYLKLEKK